MRTKEEIRLYQRSWQRKKDGTTVKSLSNSCTWKGRRAEMLALSIIGGTDMNKERLNNAYDIDLNGEKIDVKEDRLDVESLENMNWNKLEKYSKIFGELTFEKIKEIKKGIK